ncbi:MAG TPA: response regulator [Nitrososphaeraceae archaeon]|jgi:DNA-binding NtrC family response regulator
MSNTKLKIGIFEDEEDILTLYKEFLISRGHEVIFSSLNVENILPNFVKNHPDIVLLDYRFTGVKTGIDVAIEILTKYPLFPILFITGYEQLRIDILGYPILQGKNISILIKPVFLKSIEAAISNLVSKLL